MTDGQWLALILFVYAIAGVTAVAVVHVGTRKQWPCMDQEHPCPECQPEDLQ